MTKNESIKKLIELYQFKPYPYKHYESIFTRFYQGYILPIKFNIDKRYLHLSNLIISNQLSKEEAKEQLKYKPYDSESLQQDKKYVLKKLGFSENDFKNYLERPEVSHSFYKSEKYTWEKLIILKNKLKYIFKK